MPSYQLIQPAPMQTHVFIPSAGHQHITKEDDIRRANTTTEANTKTRVNTITWDNITTQAIAKTRSLLVTDTKMDRSVFSRTRMIIDHGRLLHHHNLLPPGDPVQSVFDVLF